MTITLELLLIPVQYTALYFKKFTPLASTTNSSNVDQSQ